MNGTTHRRLVRRPRLAAVAGAVVAATTLATTGPGAATAAPDESISIGMLTIVQAQLLDDIMSEFRTAVSEGLAPTDVTFEDQNANGDQTLIASIVRDFAASDHDAFAVIGTPAVIALAEQVTDRPIFAVAMSDPVAVGVAESLERPGGNVTGSIDYIEPTLLVDQLLRIHPELATIGTVHDPSNQAMQVWVGALSETLDDREIELVEATISGTADVPPASRSLLGRVDVILIGPDAAVLAGLDAVAATALGDSLPLYTVGGDVTIPGIVGSIGPDYPELGTTAGLAAVEVFTGTDPAVVPWAVPSNVELQFNGDTIDELGIEIPAEILETASVTVSTDA